MCHRCFDLKAEEVAVIASYTCCVNFVDNVSEMICFVLHGTSNLNSINFVDVLFIYVHFIILCLFFMFG